MFLQRDLICVVVLMKNAVELYSKTRSCTQICKCAIAVQADTEESRIKNQAQV